MADWSNEYEIVARCWYNCVAAAEVAERYGLSLPFVDLCYQFFDRPTSKNRLALKHPDKPIAGRPRRG